MSGWQAKIARALAEPDAPPVLNRDLLQRFARSASAGRTVPESTLTWWIRRAVEEGKLEAVQRGLYLNRFRASVGRLADAVPSFHKDAVVSLNTVLGDAGVLNNPSRGLTAVVPIDKGFPAPQLGRKQTRAGTLHFFGLPRAVLEAGSPADRLAPIERFEHPRASPEKALLDWLYLARSVHSRRTPPARGDVDVSGLDARRLRRLARAMKLDGELSRWLEEAAD